MMSLNSRWAIWDREWGVLRWRGLMNPKITWHSVRKKMSKFMILKIMLRIYSKLLPICKYRSKIWRPDFIWQRKSCMFVIKILNIQTRITCRLSYSWKTIWRKKMILSARLKNYKSKLVIRNCLLGRLRRQLVIRKIKFIQWGSKYQIISKSWGRSGIRWEGLSMTV